MAELLGHLDGLLAVALGASPRGGVKETAFPDLSANVEALHDTGAQVTVHNPMCSADKLAGFGWKPYDRVQADRAAHRELTRDLPGVRLLIDGVM